MFRMISGTNGAFSSLVEGFVTAAQYGLLPVEQQAALSVVLERSPEAPKNQNLVPWLPARTAGRLWHDARRVSTDGTPDDFIPKRPEGMQLIQNSERGSFDDLCQVHSLREEDKERLSEALNESQFPNLVVNSWRTIWRVFKLQGMSDEQIVTLLCAWSQPKSYQHKTDTDRKFFGSDLVAAYMVFSNKAGSQDAYRTLVDLPPRYDREAVDAIRVLLDLTAVFDLDTAVGLLEHCKESGGVITELPKTALAMMAAHPEQAKDEITAWLKDLVGLGPGYYAHHNAELVQQLVRLGYTGDQIKQLVDAYHPSPHLSPVPTTLKIIDLLPQADRETLFGTLLTLLSRSKTREGYGTLDTSLRIIEALKAQNIEDTAILDIVNEVLSTKLHPAACRELLETGLPWLEVKDWCTRYRAVAPRDLERYAALYAQIIKAPLTLPEEIALIRRYLYGALNGQFFHDVLLAFYARERESNVGVLEALGRLANFQEQKEINDCGDEVGKYNSHLWRIREGIDYAKMLRRLLECLEAGVSYGRVHSYLELYYYHVGSVLDVAACSLEQAMSHINFYAAVHSTNPWPDGERYRGNFVRWASSFPELEPALLAELYALQLRDHCGVAGIDQYGYFSLYIAALKKRLSPEAAARHFVDEAQAIGPDISFFLALAKLEDPCLSEATREFWHGHLRKERERRRGERVDRWNHALVHLPHDSMSIKKDDLPYGFCPWRRDFVQGSYAFDRSAGVPMPEALLRAKQRLESPGAAVLDELFNSKVDVRIDFQTIAYFLEVMNSILTGKADHEDDLKNDHAPDKLDKIKEVLMIAAIETALLGLTPNPARSYLHNLACAVHTSIKKGRTGAQIHDDILAVREDLEKLPQIIKAFVSGDSYNPALERLGELFGSEIDIIIFYAMGNRGSDRKGKSATSAILRLGWLVARRNGQGFEEARKTTFSDLGQYLESLRQEAGRRDWPTVGGKIGGVKFTKIQGDLLLSIGLKPRSEIIYEDGGSRDVHMVVLPPSLHFKEHLILLDHLLALDFFEDGDILRQHIAVSGPLAEEDKFIALALHIAQEAAPPYPESVDETASFNTLTPITEGGGVFEDIKRFISEDVRDSNFGDAAARHDFPFMRTVVVRDPRALLVKARTFPLGDGEKRPFVADQLASIYQRSLTQYRRRIEVTFEPKDDRELTRDEETRSETEALRVAVDSFDKAWDEKMPGKLFGGGGFKNIRTQHHLTVKGVVLLTWARQSSPVSPAHKRWKQFVSKLREAFEDAGIGDVLDQEWLGKKWNEISPGLKHVDEAKNTREGFFERVRSIVLNAVRDLEGMG